MDSGNQSNVESEDVASGCTNHVARKKWRVYANIQRRRRVLNWDEEEMKDYREKRRKEAAVYRKALSAEDLRRRQYEINEYKRNARLYESRNQKFWRLFIRRSKVKKLPDEIKFQVKYQYERSIGKYGRTPPSFSKAILAKCDESEGKFIEQDVKSALTMMDLIIDEVRKIKNYKVTKFEMKYISDLCVSIPAHIFKSLEEWGNGMTDQKCQLLKGVYLRM